MTWPNEPPGWTVLTDYDMHALNDGGWLNAYPEDIASGQISVVSDPTAPLSPPSVYQFWYPIGFGSGSAPATEYYEPLSVPPPKELYAGFWWKPSNPWQDNDAGNKIAFIFAQNGNGQMFLMMQGVGAPRTLTVGLEFPTDFRNLYANVNNPDVTLGVWHRIEWYAKYGSGANGIVKVWLDNVLVENYTDVTFPNDAGFDMFQFSPTFGGIGPPKTENDYYWFDHIHISVPT